MQAEPEPSAQTVKELAYQFHEEELAIDETNKGQGRVTREAIVKDAGPLIQH